MKGLPYWHPFLYKIAMKFLNRQYYRKKYMELKKEINNMSVLDIGCADCELSNYTDKDKYFGVDINEIFVNFAKKKGLNVELCDIKKKKNFLKVDCIVFSEVLHQLYPFHEDVLKRAINTVKEKVIIVEPLKHVATSKNNLLSYFGKFMNNPGHNAKVKPFKKDELFDLYKKYKFNRIKIIGRDSFAVFEK